MSVIKIIKKHTISLLIAGLCLFSSVVKSHEMWIQATDYTINAGDKINAHEMVGQNFKGNKYAYLESSFKTINVTNNGVTRQIYPRLGDMPAIQFTTLQEGLHIITAETTSSVLQYKEFQKFENFIKAEGLEWVLKEHKRRGLPDKNFKEVYWRNPKTLVKVGHGKGQDTPLGMPYEWVIETNPYTTKGDIKAQLLWQGKPETNAFVTIFNKPKLKVENSNFLPLIKAHRRTDKNGKITIPRNEGGLFLINSVKMIEPNKARSEQSKAVWESYWASLSYEIPP